MLKISISSSLYSNFFFIHSNYSISHVFVVRASLELLDLRRSKTLSLICIRGLSVSILTELRVNGFLSCWKLRSRIFKRLGHSTVDRINSFSRFKPFTLSLCCLHSFHIAWSRAFVVSFVRRWLERVTLHPSLYSC